MSSFTRRSPRKISTGFHESFHVDRFLKTFYFNDVTVRYWNLKKERHVANSFVDLNKTLTIRKGIRYVTIRDKNVDIRWPIALWPFMYMELKKLPNEFIDEEILALVS